MRTLLLSLVVASSLVAAPVVAQDKYPSKQVTLVVPFAPGGGNDLGARALAPPLQRALGQPVAVVNKTGASGAVATQSIAIAPPDGYNILVSNSNAILLPAVDRLYDRKPAFSKDDFQYVAMLTADPLMLWVAYDAPWKSLKDLIADAKAKDGAIVYSSGGLYGATHLPIEMFLKPAGIKMRHLPMSGGGPALTAVLGGNSQAVASYPGIAAPHAKANKIKSLASFGSKRHPDFPDVPTFKEQGIDIESAPWIALLIPKATPEATVKVLREAVAKSVKEPDYLMALEKAGTASSYMDQPEFTAFIEKDAALLESIVQSIGRVQQ